MTSEDRDPSSDVDTDEAGSRSSASPGRSKRKHLPVWQETILLLGIALVLAIVIKALFVQAFYIPSESMEPGLVKNDRILVAEGLLLVRRHAAARRRRRLQGPGRLAQRRRGGRPDQRGHHG